MSIWALSLLAIPVIIVIVYAVRNSSNTTPEQRVYSSPRTHTYHNARPSGHNASRQAVDQSRVLTRPVSRNLSTDHEAPKIAYKRAFLLASANDEARYFSGVAKIDGTEYAPNADAIPGTPGFHAYRDFKDAAQHIQRGNVLLEVVLSGRIEEHEIGYTATHQRVLQIIFDQCSLCKQDATRFAYHPFLDTVALFCEKHYENSVAMLHNGEIYDNPDFRPTYGVLDDIHTVLPWIAEHNIITATRTGEKKFIPTVLAEQNTTPADGR